MSIFNPMRRLGLGSDVDGNHPRAAPIRPDEPKAVQPRDAVYSQNTNVTTNVPSGELDGVETPVGRVFAEARSVTTNAGADSVDVTLVATQNGVRAFVRARAAGDYITAGSIRFWVQNHITKAWALGGVEEVLPVGAAGVQEVATTDQLVTVGAR